jgi:hypothetical protein
MDAEEFLPESYETEMLYNNDIPYLLISVIGAVDGEYKLYCQVDGLEELDYMLQRKILNYEYISKLMKELFECIYELYSYMLFPDNLVLDFQNIFYNTYIGEFRFLYIPGYKNNIRDMIRNLVEELMKMANHTDEFEREYVYTLYELVSTEMFDIDIVRQFTASYDTNYIMGTSSEKSLNQNEAAASEQEANQNIDNILSEDISDKFLGGLSGFSQKNSNTSLKYNKYSYVYKYILMATLVITILAGCILAYSQYVTNGKIQEIKSLMGILVLIVVEVFVYMEISGNKEREKPEDKEFAYVLRPNAYNHNSYYLKGNNILIGRDKACDYILDCKSVSRVHARIYLYNHIWVVEDMNSTNGTFINDYPITPGYPAIISIGDVIRLGDEEFMLCGK